MNKLIQIIKENVKRIESGKALVTPLIILNDIPEFKYEFEKAEQKRKPIFHCLKCRTEINHKGYCSKECKIAYHEYLKNYYHLHKSIIRKKVNKEKDREYQQRYRKTGKYKKWFSNYIKTPEIKARYKQYNQKRYQDPTFRAKQIEQAKKRYQQQKSIKSAMKFIFK